MIPNTVLRLNQFSVLKALVWFSVFVLLSNVKSMMYSLISSFINHMLRQISRKEHTHLLKKGLL